MPSTLLKRIDAPGTVAFAFVLEGWHTGPLMTPLAQGRKVKIRVLTMNKGRVTDTWMASDELGLLVGLDVLGLR